MFSFLAIARQYSFSSPKINHCGKWKKKKKSQYGRAWETALCLILEGLI